MSGNSLWFPIFNTKEAFGEPKQIISITSKGVLNLHDDVLSKILCDENVKSKHICVVSIAGAFRKGKSFLLSFLLKYLEAKGDKQWLHRQGKSLNFSWRKGYERETTGIWAWSKLHIMKTKGLGEVAVMLLDTQGTFDTQSTLAESTRIFGLSALLSSVLIYNISQRIQEDDIQHLNYFSEYGKLATDNSKDKPFQTILFLIRDWCNSDEFRYGSEGGKAYLADVFSMSKHRDPELNEERFNIDKCFEEKLCFLMAHPGMKVLSAKFKGNLEDIDSNFLASMNSLSKMLLSTRKIKVKKVNGVNITCETMLATIRKLIEVFNEDNRFPKPQSLLKVTAELCYNNALDAAREHYMKEIKKIDLRQGGYIHPASLAKCLEDIAKEAFTVFQLVPKLENAESFDKFYKRLQEAITETASAIENENEKKCPKMARLLGMLASAYTPSTTRRRDMIIRVVNYFYKNQCRKITRSATSEEALYRQELTESDEDESEYSDSDDEEKEDTSNTVSKDKVATHTPQTIYQRLNMVSTTMRLNLANIITLPAAMLTTLFIIFLSFFCVILSKVLFG